MNALESILVIIALNVAMYWKILWNDYIVDDYQMYVRNSKGEGENLIKEKSWLGFIKFKLYGAGTFSYKDIKGTSIAKAIMMDNALVLVLHTTVCVLMYLTFGANLISFWAAVLYTINPINNQTSVWKNGRRFQINSILVLLMLLWKPLGIFLYFITPLFQINAIFAPILYAHENAWYLLALIPLLIFGRKELTHKVQVRMERVCDDDRLVFTPKRFFIIVKHYGHYFFKMVFPGLCAMNYAKLHYWGVTEQGNKNAYSFNKDFWQGILALAISVCVFVLLMSQNASYACFWAFMVFSALQWCAILPYIQDLADRYATLPTIFMMFFISYAVNTFIPQYAFTILLVLGTYYAFYLNMVRKMYGNMDCYFRYQMFHFPQIPLPRKMQVNYLIKLPDFVGAWVLCREGLMYNPNEFILLHQAAMCHKAIGDYVKAREYARKAMENYYIGQKESQEPLLKEFLQSLERPEPQSEVQIMPNIDTPMSRQQRRALERKQSK